MNNMNMQKWVVFSSHWKSRKLLLMLFAELKYYQKRSERLFEVILVFQGSFGVCYIRVFVNFLDDPYYEPLLWFMISLCMCIILQLCMYVCVCACIKGIATELKNVWTPIIYSLKYISMRELSFFDSLIQLLKPTIHLYWLDQCPTRLKFDHASGLYTTISQYQLGNDCNCKTKNCSQLFRHYPHAITS